MIAISLGQFLKAAVGDVTGFSADQLEINVGGVSTDSRIVGCGDVFFALKGERFDGADYAEKALDAGALAVVVHKDSMRQSFEGKPVVAADDPVFALGNAAREYRLLFSSPVVAITGTSGKTTAKDMTLAVLGTSFNVHGTRGNFNNHIGLPLSVFGMEDGHECAVLEMGMSAPGEIARLSEIAAPDIGVVLNVGPAHMEFFPSLEAVADAKLELVGALHESGVAVVNADDQMLVRADERCQGRFVNFSVGGSADFVAENVAVGRNGCASFTVEGLPVSLKIPGVHTVYNALAAYTVGRLLGVDPKKAAEALSACTVTGMRMEVLEKDGVTFINDTYNANPMSMKSAADVLRDMTPEEGGRKIAVIGDMLELGIISREAHRNVGAIFGRLDPALLCVVGGNAAHYREGAVNVGMDGNRIKEFRNSDDAAEYIRQKKQPGDVILVKGSRGVKMETVLKD